MAQIIVRTPNYGEVRVKSVMLPYDKNFVEGVDVYDDTNAWWFDAAGVSIDDLEGEPEKLEELINSNAF